MKKFQKMKSQTPLDIIIDVAKIVKNDIGNMPCDKTEYPDISKMDDIEYAKNWIPDNLNIFLSHLVSSRLKQVSIGQIITQSARPRSMIASIPFGIGVDVDKSFATKWLVNHLHQFGFSISSDEVNLFKESAISSSRENCSKETQSEFMQWSADNADHNIQTLTGKGSFHGMGIISAITKPLECMAIIKRLKHNQLSGFSEFNIEILPFHGSSTNGLSKVKLKAFKKLLPGIIVLAPEMNLDLVWKTSWLFKKSNPNWSRFTQTATKTRDEFFKKSSIDFLPMIDLRVVFILLCNLSFVKPLVIRYLLHV